MEIKERPTPEQDLKTGRFVAGNAGNGGRPKGSRNKLSEIFWSDLFSVWEVKGKESMLRMAEDEPSKFVSCVASLQTKFVEVSNDFVDMDDDELRLIFHLARKARENRISLREGIDQENYSKPLIELQAIPKTE